MWEIFLIGTFWFWAILAVEFVLLILCTEYESPFWAGFSLLCVLAALQFMGNVPVIAWSTENPLKLGGCIAGYFVIGTFWGCIKWWFHVRGCRDKYIELREEWMAGLKGQIARLKRSGGSESNHAEIAAYQEVLKEGCITDAAKKYWTDYITGSHRSRNTLKPLVSRNKRRILLWMAWWPFSALWTIINDPVRKIFKTLYNSVKGWLQKISDYIYADIENELENREDDDQWS